MTKMKPMEAQISILTTKVRNLEYTVNKLEDTVRELEQKDELRAEYLALFKTIALGALLVTGAWFALIGLYTVIT